MAEPCATDLVRLATEIAHDLHRVELPLALFGHSMGAPVALETARSLEAGGRPVAHLFASGSRNAPLPPPGAPALTGSDDDLLSSIEQLGGTDAALVGDPGFRKLVLPYLRADADMFHGYAMRAEPRLQCPVTTIVGDQDEHADLRPWGDLTHRLTERVVPGGHFYLADTPPLALVAAGLGTTTSESEIEP
jgi:pyochelin biosynthetic protein PchC